MHPLLKFTTFTRSLFICLFLSVLSIVAHASEIEVTVTPLNATYENGKYVDYQINVKNTTAKRLHDVSVRDLIWDTTADSASGRVKAFTNLTITSSSNYGSKPGIYTASDTNLLALDAQLFPYGSIQYQVRAQVADPIIGDIVLDSASVSVDIDNDGVAEIYTPSAPAVFKAVPYEYSLEVSVDKSEYVVGQALTYTLVVQNKGSYQVQGLNIEQPFQSLSVENSSGSSSSPFQHVAISGKKAGSDSDLGSFSPDGDLLVSAAKIAVGGKLTYTIVATVGDDVTGDIITSAIASTKDGDITSLELDTPPAKPLVTIEHSLDKTNPYLVSSTRTFSVKVENSGSGIAHNYHVKQNIADLVANLGLGNNLQSEHNNADVTGNLFSHWAIEVDDIGPNSKSKFKSLGSQADVEFDDAISLYPGETIHYTIKATLSPVAMGEIQGVSASVEDAENNLVQDAQITNVVKAERTLQVTDPEIKIVKSSNESEYTPGNQVRYDIEVSNSSSKYFANDLKVVDDLTCVQTDQAGGAGQGQAFKRWKLEPASAEDSKGTDPGTYNYGAWTTAPITVSPDIAPGQTVAYTLTAEVSDTSIGLIVDSDPACSDNVIEDGSGIQMPEDNLRASKDVDSRYYSSGDVLTYTIRVDNDGKGFADQVPVVDDLGAVQTTDISGKVIPAFESWTITAQAFHSDGTSATATDTGIKGTINSPDTLNVKATIEPGSYVIYTIAAKTNPLANGHIQNTVTVDNSVYADRGSDPRDFEIELNKTVKTDGDSGFHSDHTGYSKLDSEVTYQIHVKNAKGNGYATNVRVKDEISTITAGLLEPDSASKPVFSSWTISAEIISDDPLLNGNATYTDVGDFDDNKDLDLTAQIAPNVEVVYTIVAKIDRSVSSEIVYERFTNTAHIETRDSDAQTGATDSAVVYPKAPDVVVVKTTKENKFVPGQWVEFNVTVYNRGAGYANDVAVHDDIKGMNAFSKWTIEAKTDSNNTTYNTGSYADTKAHYPDNGNIDTKVDIDPKTSDGMGYVTYIIRGLVKNDYASTEISNTVEIHDPVNNLDQSATAEIGDSGDERLNVSILKTADRTRFVPGEDVTYFITLQNNSENTAESLKLVDPLTEIRSVLANKKDDHFANYEDQSPFEYWQFDYADGKGWQGQTTDDLIYPPGLDSSSFSLAAGETRTFKVKAHVKDNVVGSLNGGLLERKIANDAYVFQDYKKVTQTSHVSHHEMDRVDSGGWTDRTLLVNGKQSRFYAPGDTLTYKVKVASKNGYYNDHKVTEDIKGVQTQLLDGTTANPFKNVFTVKAETDNSNGGKGTTDGTQDGVVQDNENIDTMIDVAGGDYVLYTVEGVVRDDAVGNITIGDDTVEPYEYHLNFTKKVDQVNYQPGKDLIYHLTINNNGQGNAYNIPVEDQLSKIEVELLDGTKGKAFPNGWTIETNVLGGSPVAQPDLDKTIKDNADIVTHVSIPAGETIEYVVTAKVNTQATGSFVNVFKVDGDSVSAESKPDTEKYDFEKHLVASLDKDGTMPLTGGYTPGGYLVYEIILRNSNNVHLQDVTIVDDIRGISTDYYDGSVGQAFDSWTITTQVDSSGLSNAGSVKNNENIDTQFNLAGSAFASEGSFVKYTIKAKISEKAVGSIQNIAQVDGTHSLRSERMDMLAANLKKTHKAYTDTTLATQKTTYNFDPSLQGQNVVYHLRLVNTGKGTEYASSLKEMFSNIKNRLAQNAAGESNDQKESTYQPYGWSVTVTKSDELVTDIGGYTGGRNADIDIPTLSIAAGGWVDFIIESTIRDDTLDAVEAKPFYNGSVFQKSTIKPDAQNLEVTKQIVSVGGRAYSKGDTYKLGEEVVYHLNVSNQAKVWTDQTRIQDLISDITVEVLGGSTQQAFESHTITHDFDSGLNSAVDTYMPDYDASDDLDLLLDIGPAEAIEFTIKGTIRSDALGDIDANHATAGGVKVETPAIPPVAPNLVIEKLVINTTADGGSCTFPSTTGDGCEYNPGGQVSYTISVENTGEGIANDVEIIDKLNTISTSTSTKAFSSISTTVVEQPSADRFSISGSYSGSKPLDAKFDLMPGDKVVFGVAGEVDSDATGTITNIAKVDGVDTNDIVLGQGSAEIYASKSTDTPTYVPGGEVRYTMYIANTSDSNADVKVKDAISSFMVETADGSTQTALTSWTTTASFVGNATAEHNDASAIQTSGDIDAVVKLGAAGTEPTVLKIDVVGKVRDDAVGKFGNTLYVDTKQYDLKQHFIYPEPGSLAVSKTPSVSPALYAPGDSIGFDIVVENTGTGYLTNVNVKDLVADISANLVGDSVKGKAFDEWDAAKSSVKVIDSGASPSVITSESGFSGTDSFTGIYQLAPGSKIELHLQGTVNSDVVGPITNQVSVSADGVTDAIDEATYQPIDAEVLVTKSVDKPTYLAEDTLTYTVVLTNTQRVWATDVHVEDLIDRISSETIFGTTISAFDSDSIEITAVSDKGTTTLPVLSGKFIQDDVNIAPEDVVTITITGTLKPEIIGEVKNTVTVDYDGKNVQAEAVSEPIVPSIEVVKAPLNATYTPGTYNGFTITIRNKDAAFANDIAVKDAISTMMVKTIGTDEKPAFSRWHYSYKADDPMTTVGPDSSSWNKDIDHTVDLAPNDTIVFTIEGTVESTAIGQIDNTATVTFDGKDNEASAVIDPEPSNISVTKVADREFYQAGLPAQFTVTVTNDGAGFANDVVINDLMSDVQVTLVDGTTGPAFENWTVDTQLSDPRTVLNQTPSGVNPDIQTTADIAPNSQVTFVINGTVNHYATTDITNTVNVDLDGKPTLTAEATIKQRPISLKLEKFVGDTGTDTEMFYEPGEQATFRVILTNQNEAFAAGIKLKDLLDELEVDTVNGTREKALESWTIKVNKGNELTTVSPDPSGSNQNVDATVNLAPKDVLELVVTGKVNQYANGTIDNKAIADVSLGDSTRLIATASLKPEPDNVQISEVADNPIYVAGEKATFRVTLFNDSKGFANDIHLHNVISGMLVQTRPDISSGDREYISAFTDWTLDISSSDPRSNINVGTLSVNTDVSITGDIAPGDKVELAITGTTDPRAMGEIVNISQMIQNSPPTESGGLMAGYTASMQTVNAMITPKAVDLVVDKTTTKGENVEYTNDDDELTYVLRVTNQGSATIHGAEMVDEISKLVGANGNALFTSWTMQIKELPSGQIKADITDKDLNLPGGGVSLDLLAYMGNGFEITITGQLNKGLDDDITNTFTVTDPNTGISASDDVTIHVKKFADNEGDLLVTKEALKETAQVGDVVEYEVTVVNNNQSEFKNVKLVDRYPSGFAYVPGSTELTNSGPDGEFDTGDDVISTADPAVTSTLTFNVGDMLAYGSSDTIITEKVRIRYLLRVTVGATFGKYVNSAVAMTPPEGQESGALVENSNTATATVEVEPDKVFDTASIIGKVFQDHNQDGFQADATAFDVSLTANVDPRDYIANSTVVIEDGQEQSLSDSEYKSKQGSGYSYGVTSNKGEYHYNAIQATPKVAVPGNLVESALVQGYEIDKLFGISQNRTLPKSNKVVFQLATKSDKGFSFSVVTQSGTRFAFDAVGHIRSQYVGDKKQGLSAENLNVTRNLYKDGDHYLWEIVIENKGIYEDGIPGVRLITTEGIVIETDQYGRYHIPDQWVLDKKGQNFLVKLDTDSLPTGMKVVSENPRVQRISPNKLTKFNFSVALKEDK